MATAWLPKTTLRERKALQVASFRSPGNPAVRLSEFIAVSNIFFFGNGVSKISVVETMTRSLFRNGLPEALRSIWYRERAGALAIGSDVAVLRGRLGTQHHIRAALGLCPSGFDNPSVAGGRTKVALLMVGPIDQDHLHMSLLVAASSILSRPSWRQKLLQSTKASAVLAYLRDAEGSAGPGFIRRTWDQMEQFLGRRFGWQESHQDFSDGA